MNKTQGTVVLGGKVSLADLVRVARDRAPVSFNETYRQRVNASRQLVDQFVAENRLIYGVTTGVGDNVKHVIAEEEAANLQEKILLSHCTTVGDPLDEEGVRATLFVMLTNLGTGYAGIRLCVLERIAQILNKGITPWAPKHGSVGYLGVEAHIALVLLGKGRACYQGQWRPAHEVLQEAGIEPLHLSYKEGLCLSSGVTCATALAALAAHDAYNALCAANVVACLSFEALRGNPQAFDERVMAVKQHPDQARVAAQLRQLLTGSQIIDPKGAPNLQDALSLRCIPQAHGAARKTIFEAISSIENELNSCADNPIIHPSGEALSACNADAGFVGIAADSLCIAACYLAKIAERRTDRMLNAHVSGLPAFLIAGGAENSGYMIVQYASAGLLGEMRVLSHPASIDSISTCALQEDYVSMGYGAALKSREVIRLLEYVISNELLTAAQALDFRADKTRQPAKVACEVLSAVRERAAFMEKDHYIANDMEWTWQLVHSGRVRSLAEQHIGSMR